ncbi:MAG TPA: aminopeptidase P family protein [Candidatus Omnitrophica bacterium]|nr:aminopeptidase P family protein [Candidatus Omnitrophota bacterium]
MKRIEKCVKEIKRLNLDALLINSSVNITYLSGFKGSYGNFLLVSKTKELFYFTSPIYEEEAKKISFWRVIVSNGNIFDLITKIIKEQRFKKVGFEAKYLPFLEYEKIKEEIMEVDFIKTVDLVGKIRAIKTDKEISLIKKAIEVTEEGFKFLEEIFEENMTEKDLAIELEKFLRLKADNCVAFPPIVASGKNSFFPHYLAQEKKIDSSFLLVDLGAKYRNYCADLTRIFFWDKISPQLRKVYRIIKDAQKLAISKVKEGVKVKELDQKVREFIEKKGLGKYLRHSLGHGIGLEVHEYPFIDYRNNAILKEGMVITVEPGIYIKGKFGLRLEDVVLVKKERGEVLSETFHI